MSTTRCCSTSNLPIGWPNCFRVLRGTVHRRALTSAWPIATHRFGHNAPRWRASDRTASTMRMQCHPRRSGLRRRVLEDDHRRRAVPLDRARSHARLETPLPPSRPPGTRPRPCPRAGRRRCGPVTSNCVRPGRAQHGTPCWPCRHGNPPPCFFAADGEVGARLKRPLRFGRASGHDGFCRRRSWAAISCPPGRRRAWPAARPPITTVGTNGSTTRALAELLHHHHRLDRPAAQAAECSSGKGGQERDPARRTAANGWDRGPPRRG